MCVCVFVCTLKPVHYLQRNLVRIVFNFRLAKVCGSHLAANITMTGRRQPVAHLQHCARKLSVQINFNVLQVEPVGLSNWLTSCQMTNEQMNEPKNERMDECCNE